MTSFFFQVQRLRQTEGMSSPLPCPHTLEAVKRWTWIPLQRGGYQKQPVQHLYYDVLCEEYSMQSS